jgi:hypothetical protein
LQLVNQGRLVLEAQEKLEIEGRFHRRGLNAVVVASDHVGTLGCASTIAVIEARGHAPLGIRLINGSELCGYEVLARRRGLEIGKRRAEIEEPAIIYKWYADGRFIREVRDYRPHVGTNLGDLVNLGENGSPLQNEEFFGLLKSDAGHDWKLFAYALEHSHLLSSTPDGRFHIFGGCKTDLVDRCSIDGGRWWRSQNALAFAAVDIRRHQAFFAVRLEPSGFSERRKTKSRMIVHPSRHAWPAKAWKALRDWIAEISAGTLAQAGGP